MAVRPIQKVLVWKINTSARQRAQVTWYPYEYEKSCSGIAPVSRKDI